MKLFGVKGELIIELYDGFPDNFDTEEPVFVKIDSLPVPLFFDRFERRGATGALAVFADIDTKTRAAELVGLPFYVEVVAEESHDELYAEDLIGFVARLGGGRVGRITDFLDNVMNPLFEVEIDGRRVLIPAADDFIAEVDEESSSVSFELPDGLLDLNH